VGEKRIVRARRKGSSCDTPFVPFNKEIGTEREPDTLSWISYFSPFCAQGKGKTSYKPF